MIFNGSSGFKIAMEYFYWSAAILLLGSLIVDGQNNEDCNGLSCKPPDCYCPSTRIPGDLDPITVPQMVIFAFSGPLTGDHRKYIDEMFRRSRKNPNGSPIRMTLFVSDDDGETDYCSVNKLWSAGNEVASFSISRREPPYFWATANQNNWEEEIDGQRVYLLGNATFEITADNNITGFRSPHLQTGGNAQYRFALDKGYLYDSSIVLPAKFTEDTQPKLWPYTMDFPNGLDCYSYPCPDGHFPGLWQIPVQPLSDVFGRGCNILNSCVNPPTSSDELFDMLMQSFNRSYNNNRVPVMVNFLNYKTWFDDNEPWALDGLHRFIDEVLSYAADDVWFVTYSDVISWMKAPVQNKLLGHFAPFDRERNRANGPECVERRRPPPFLNGVGLVVFEIGVFTVAFMYLYVKDNSD